MPRSTITGANSRGMMTVTGSARCIATRWKGSGRGCGISFRPFRGVNKVYLEQYAIMFEWSFNLKAVTDEFLRIMVGSNAATELVT
jgi:hypothetical protein